MPLATPGRGCAARKEFDDQFEGRVRVARPVAFRTRLRRSSTRRSDAEIGRGAQAKAGGAATNSLSTIKTRTAPEPSPGPHRLCHPHGGQGTPSLTRIGAGDGGPAPLRLGGRPTEPAQGRGSFSPAGL